MGKKYLGLYLFFLPFVIITMTLPSAFASTINVIIENGASTHSCKSDTCLSPNPVSIQRGDQIVWKNMDLQYHRIESGNPTQGPDGYFDSGSIPPGGTYVQLFYKYGTYGYFDPKYSWIKGDVEVGGIPHAALSWAPGMNIVEQSNSTLHPYVGFLLSITKLVQNSGDDNASNVTCELQIYTDKKVMVYNQFITTDIKQGKVVPLTYQWTPTTNGTYFFIFTADSRNVITEVNKSNDIVTEVATINQYPNISPLNTPTLNTQPNQTVPEFGFVAPIILAISIVSIIFLSFRTESLHSKGLISRTKQF